MFRTLVAAFNAWRHNVGNILSTFEKTTQRLIAAAAHHDREANAKSDAADRLLEQASTSRATATQALTVAGKIGALIN